MINPDQGNMVRDERDVWPDDEPVGSFSIEAGPGHSVQGYPGSTGHIMFICPNNKRCSVLIGPTFVQRPTKDTLCIWGWDGNLDKPTLTPSINCIAEKDGKPTGGCGWHGFITSGIIK
jgi:hypothetical protein